MKVLKASNVTCYPRFTANVERTHHVRRLLPFVDSGDPAPDNTHLTGAAPIQEANRSGASTGATERSQSAYTTRISVYDDMLSTPRVIVVEQADVRTYLEDVTNTVHRTMKEQGGHLSLMIIRELVENFIHAQFSEPVISILDTATRFALRIRAPASTTRSARLNSA